MPVGQSQNRLGRTLALGPCQLPLNGKHRCGGATFVVGVLSTARSTSSASASGVLSAPKNARLLPRYAMRASTVGGSLKRGNARVARKSLARGRLIARQDRGANQSVMQPSAG